VLADVGVFLFLCVFFTCFLTVGVAVVLLAAGALELLAGACAAKVSGMAATASPIASRVFFMVSFSPWRALMPAHTLILRQQAKKHDSLRRLMPAPNQDAHRLMFIRIRA
jgi:hypothetical protein